MAEETKKVTELSAAIELPEGVQATIQNEEVACKGPKGEVKRAFHDRRIAIESKDGKISLKAVKVNKTNKKRLKSYAAHIRNMVKGSNEGHAYTLKICSGHFPMNVSVNNNEFIIKNFLGEKVPRVLKLKEGAQVKVEGDQVIVESASKEIAGQVAADIETLTKRSNFDTRIFQDGIYIINKDGKEI